MNSWKPVSREQISEFIENGSAEFTEEEYRFFKAISIPPEKWQLAPWGNEGDGFWVVGIIGEWIIWYNDIEEGFNSSTYSKHGEIGQYWCDQDDFQWAVKFLKSYLDTGIHKAKLGPPIPVD